MPPLFFTPPRFFSPPLFFSPPRFFAPPTFFGPPGFFSPPRFFGPPGFCIPENTNVLTKDGYKKAKEIVNGDILITAVFDEIPEGDPNCTIGSVSKKCISLVDAWNSDSLENVSYIESTVFDINEQDYASIVRINDEEKYDLSTQEQILIKRANKYKFITSSKLKQGDQIVSYKDNELEFIDVEKVEIVKKDTKVYLIYREPWGLLIAESMLAYNGCKTLQDTID